jgi:hypothetical protein
VKWVFKVKRDEHEVVSKYEARIMVKGYTQRHNIDLVHLLIALAVHEGWEVHHMDVKSVFLNGDLYELVYVEQPMGFIIAGKEPKVLKVRKAMYGLHQAL